MYLIKNYKLEIWKETNNNKLEIKTEIFKDT